MLLKFMMRGPQVRMALQKLDPNLAEVLTSHLAKRLSEQGRLAGTVLSLQVSRLLAMH